jgi:hypothetical protein
MVSLLCSVGHFFLKLFAFFKNKQQALILRTVLRTAARVEEVAEALSDTQRQLGNDDRC